MIFFNFLHKKKKTIQSLFRILKWKKISSVFFEGRHIPLVNLWDVNMILSVCALKKKGFLSRQMDLIPELKYPAMVN